ncbi:reverse transcriptase domain-containing protein [Tanacetum coccineum]
MCIIRRLSLCFFYSLLRGAACRCARKEPPRGLFLTWEYLVPILNEFLSSPQERQISEMKFPPFNNCLAAKATLFGIIFKDTFQQPRLTYIQGSGSLPSNTIANPKGELKAITTRSGLVLDRPFVLMPPPFINPEEDERAEETLTDPELAEYTIKLKCKLLADLGAKHQLDATLYTFEKDRFISAYFHAHYPLTTNRAILAICTPAGIARDVFVPVGKFTFPADFVIVDYESDPRVPLILGRPFLRTARALIDVHGEEMILRDGDERLILNMRHDTSSYSNKPKKESINMIDIYNVSHEDYLEDLFANEKITNHLSGNPTPISDPIVSSSPTLTSLEESDLIWEEFEAYLASDSFPPGSDDTDFDPEGDLRLIEELLNNDPSSPLPLSHNPLSGSTTSSSPDHLLEEFADELALITFPPGNDDLPFDIESDLREIEYLLNHDPTKEMDSILEDSVDEGNLADPNNDLVDTIPEMFTDEHTLDYSSPPLYDDVDDDLVELESDNDDVYDDPFDSKEDKIKESKLLIDELDPPRSSDFLPSPKCDSVLYEDFSKVDALPSTNNEDKVFNPGILIHENLFEVTIRVTPDKNEKKISISNASLILEDFNPPLYELPFHKKVPGSKILLSFSFKNEKKVFNPENLTSKGVHTSLLLELSHRGPKAFKVIKIFESPMDIFPCSYGEDIRDCPDFEASHARAFVLRSLELQILGFIMGIQYPNLID